MEFSYTCKQCGVTFVTHTADKLTLQQRVNYSRAAVQRVLAGVSGYKTGHVTGVYVGAKSASPVRFKSSWELAAMMWWDRASDVAVYAYEPDVIELDDGRRAIPDFLVTYVSGHKTYVEVKPTAIQALPEVAERLVMVKAKVEASGLAYATMGNGEIDVIKASLGKELTDAIERYQGGS